MAKFNEEANYFQIGLFTLIGLGLIIIAFLVFGSNKLFRTTTFVESYFNESVRGITAGSQVKYRGLPVGHVEELNFVAEVYSDLYAQPSEVSAGYPGNEQIQDPSKIHEQSRLANPKIANPQAKNTVPGQQHRMIYVKIALTAPMFTKFRGNRLQQFLTEEVKRGLRISLITQGLAGTNYLELDYVDPRTNSIPHLTWTPRYFYIPAITSTLTRLSEGTQHILGKFQAIDFQKIFDHLDQLTVSLNQISLQTTTLLNKIDDPMTTTLRNLQAISEDLKFTAQRIRQRPAELIFSSPPPILDPKKL